MALIIISIFLIVVYTVAVIIKTKGIPYSISATYYAIKHKLAFGACMVISAMLMMPVMLDLSTTFTMKALSVLSCVGMAGVGLAPDFRDNWINKIHCTSATITLVCSQAWIMCSLAWWALLPVWIGFIAYILFGIFRYSDFFRGYIYFKEAKPMFWGEVAAISAETIATVYLTIIFR